MFFFCPFKKNDAKRVLKEIQNENQTNWWDNERIWPKSPLHSSRKVATRSDVKLREYYQFNRHHIQNCEVWTSTFLYLCQKQMKGIICSWFHHSIWDIITCRGDIENVKEMESFLVSLCDYSDAVFSALKASFPAVKVYLWLPPRTSLGMVDQRPSTWSRYWTSQNLLENLRACA